VLSIPIGEEGVAGEVRTVASGLPLVDDLAFAGDGDTLLAALNRPNEVALVQADGSHTTVLTGEDGLQSPTSIAVQGDQVFVANAAYNTNTDPNLLRATLGD
jgi:hypothetical protein